MQRQSSLLEFETLQRSKFELKFVSTLYAGLQLSSVASTQLGSTQQVAAAQLPPHLRCDSFFARRRKLPLAAHAARQFGVECEGGAGVAAFVVCAVRALVARGQAAGEKAELVAQNVPLPAALSLRLEFEARVWLANKSSKLLQCQCQYRMV